MRRRDLVRQGKRMNLKRQRRPSRRSTNLEILGRVRRTEHQKVRNPQRSGHLHKIFQLIALRFLQIPRRVRFHHLRRASSLVSPRVPRSLAALASPSPPIASSPLAPISRTFRKSSLRSFTASAMRPRVNTNVRGASASLPLLPPPASASTCVRRFLRRVFAMFRASPRYRRRGIRVSSDPRRVRARASVARRREARGAAAGRIAFASVCIFRAT